METQPNTASNSRAQRALTLIEVLVTTLIIGVLLGIAVPLYSATQKDSKLKACKANMMSIYQAEEAYRVKYRGYATSLTDANLVKIMGGAPTCPTNSSIYTLLVNNSTSPITIHLSCNGTHTTKPHLLAPVGTTAAAANAGTGDACITAANPDTQSPEFKITGSP